MGVTSRKEANIMTTKTLSKNDLALFTGSDNWYRHGINPNVRFTDGAKYLADEGGAYWLLDTIAICQRFEKTVTCSSTRFSWKFPVDAR